MTPSSSITVAHTKGFLMITLLIWRKEDGGGKDFGESNSMYHLTWKFWFYQGFFSFSISMDPSCCFLHLLDSWVKGLKYFKVMSQLTVIVIPGTTRKKGFPTQLLNWHLDFSPLR